MVGQDTRGGADVCLEDGSDWRLKGCFRVMGAKGAEVVGSQQELGCIPHGRHVQVAEITNAEQRKGASGRAQHVRWVKVQLIGERLKPGTCRFNTAPLGKPILQDGVCL